MKTRQAIAIKRQELNQQRHTISATMGPRNKQRHGMGFGLVFAGFALGVIVERWGVRPVATSALAANRYAHMASAMGAPVFDFLNS